MHFRGNEADVILLPDSPHPGSVAIIHNTANGHHTLVIVNVADKVEHLTIYGRQYGLEPSQTVFENISGKSISISSEGKLPLTVQPYQRLWLTRKKIEIPPNLLIRA